MLIVTPAWNTPADLTRWWQAAGNAALARIQFSWTTEQLGWGDLEWDTMPATPNKQHWQKVDKILEIVDFMFERDLTNDEKTAVEERVYALTKQV
jgi:hypothetical protein